jgi:tetratricopeptide (TPR) repeat protein
VFLLSLSTFILFKNLKLSEKNAQQLTEKLQLEQEFNKQMGVDSAPLFLQRAIDAFDICEFDESLRFANNAISRDSNLREAWLVKAKAHFIKEEFHAAIEAFQKIDSSHYDLMIKIAKKFILIKTQDNLALSITQHLNLLSELKPLERGDVYWKIVHYKAFQELSIEDRIDFCHGIIRLTYGETKKLNLKFNPQTKHLDISNNPWLNNSLCFLNFPATSITLSKTGINNPIGLRAIPLEKVDMSYTKIIELQTFPCRQVKELNISHNSITHIAPIIDRPIEILHIQNTLIQNSHDLTQLKHLKELHIHQGQLKPRELENLSKAVKIITHPQ